ncbi:hypothetical protein [Deinococcus ruber]|nr:hypothetical protein [Deinococcus ruber]
MTDEHVPLGAEQEQRCWLGQALGSLEASLDVHRAELIHGYGHATASDARIEAIFRRSPHVFHVTVIATPAGAQRHQQLLLDLPRTFRPMTMYQRGNVRVAEDYHFRLLRDEQDAFVLYRRTDTRVYPLLPDGSVHWNAVDSMPAPVPPRVPSRLWVLAVLGLLLLVTLGVAIGHREPFPALGVKR